MLSGTGCDICIAENARIAGNDEQNADTGGTSGILRR
jgi:hypothetical protein